MKQVIRLTESELKNIVENSVRRAIKEGAVDEGMKDWLKTGAIGAGIGLGAAGVAGTDNPISRGLDRQFADQEEVGRAFPEDREEFGDALNPGGSIPNDTIGWEQARTGKFENRIRKAVMESIMGLMNEISTDTMDSASDKASRKYLDTRAKYGENDPRARRAGEQSRKFANAWNDQYIHGNDARKARLDKNREDRKNGARTYQKGIGWRTKQGQ